MTSAPSGIMKIMRQYLKIIRQSDDIKLCKVLNSITSIGRRDESFLGTLNALVDYACPSKLLYETKILDGGVEVIVHDTIPSYYPWTRARSTYICYVQFAMVIVKNEEAFHSLEIWAPGFGA